MPPQELLELFIQESSELINELETGLLHLEKDPGDREQINSIFRAAHIIKGNAGLVGFEPLVEFTHAMETVLDHLRSGLLQIEVALINALLASVDVVKSMIDQAARGTIVTAEIPGHQEALRQLLSWAEGHGPTTPAEKKEAAKKHQDHLPQIPVPPAAGPEPSRSAPSQQMPTDPAADLPAPCSTASFSALTAPAPDEESEISAAPGEEHPSLSMPHDELGEELPTVQYPDEEDDLPGERSPGPRTSALGSVAPRPVPDRSTSARESGAMGEGSVRVNVRVLDRLMTLAGEMVLTRNQLLQSTKTGQSIQIERAAQRVNLITTDLQDAIMATRMQSMRTIFQKLQRLVRDLAHELDKQVKLILEGEEVELDKTIIEAIADPLTHLVRNALDHGIEKPARRRRAGKPEVGTLHITASHKAGQVILEVTDDGQGIDPARLKERALAMGLATRQELESMPQRALTSLIFRPGFSTAELITEISGRGVGMDVVYANLTAIGGTVEVDSTPSLGCTIRVKLPLTLAILPSLLVEVESQRYAIPQVNLVELRRIAPQDVQHRIEKIGSLSVIRSRNDLLPLVHLREILGIEHPTFVHPVTELPMDDRRRNIADRRTATGSADQEWDRPDRRQGSERRIAVTSAVYIAVVTTGDYQYGLVVDQMLDSTEIVVKPLGRHLSGCRSYAGATVLGDGKVALILDVAGIGQDLRTSAARDDELARRQALMSMARSKVADHLSLLLVANAPGETLGIPLAHVDRILKTTRSAIDTAAGRRVLKLQGRSLLLFTLDEVADVSALPEQEKLFVIVFRLGTREAGLLVGQVIDTLEAEVTIDDLAHRQAGLWGSAIIGDRLVLLVDLRDMALQSMPELAALVQPEAETSPKQRVLIVEDSAFFQSQIAELMEEAGYQVETADNGAVALSLLTQQPEAFDIVLTDIEMPVLDGFGLVEQMRRHPRLERLPVIAITSLMGQEARARGVAVGIDEYTIKLDRDQVLERCRYLLANGRPASNEEI